MHKRYVSVWFRYFKTDWYTRRQPLLGKQALVLFERKQGRMIITAANQWAEMQSVYPGMLLADARAIAPGLQAFEENNTAFGDSLQNIAEWMIRFSPVIAVQPPDGLLVDCTGCCHLFGGEQKYLETIEQRFQSMGFTLRLAMAGTAGTAFALARYGEHLSIVQNGDESAALSWLPPKSLRINSETNERLYKLGLRHIIDLLQIPFASLRRRLGEDLIIQLQCALGYREEILTPVIPTLPYCERLLSIEPIVTLTGIEIGMQHLLKSLCTRLQQEENGLRTANFSIFRTDGTQQTISISISRPSANTEHLFKLLALKFPQLSPLPGIELFILDAPFVEPLHPVQEQIFTSTTANINNPAIAELIDRISNKIGAQKVKRYLPAEHYWPERAIKATASLEEKATTQWNNCIIRPLTLLDPPLAIAVTAPIPDYPPMNFRYQGKLHKILRADGPERIEQEWWLQEGEHRDYYYAEDEEGKRYWLFRSGHYDPIQNGQWFLHGYFA